MGIGLVFHNERFGVKLFCFSIDDDMGGYFFLLACSVMINMEAPIGGF